jgi:broad specificity phosphatase PhoE
LSGSTRLFLVRHADVENPSGIIYGYLPGFGLSARGVSQAEALGKFLQSSPVRRIYTSPLQRSEETARIIARFMPAADVVPDPDLRESSLARYLQGVTEQEVLRKRPLWRFHKYWPGLMWFDESIAALAKRVGRSLQRLIAEFPGEGGLCISHGDPIQAFWYHHGRSSAEVAKAKMQTSVDKGGMLQLDYEGFSLLRIAYISPEDILRGIGVEAPGSATRRHSGNER